MDPWHKLTKTARPEVEDELDSVLYLNVSPGWAKWSLEAVVNVQTQAVGPVGPEVGGHAGIQTPPQVVQGEASECLLMSASSVYEAEK